MWCNLKKKRKIQTFCISARSQFIIIIIYYVQDIEGQIFLWRQNLAVTR